ncbi:MAG TPA: hypothetical protein EYN88_05760, partial [Candidatus Poseidoniales archaeon]|nr:hypothetical protein [Candidatus Poseidoniales archaeon]
MRRVSGQLEFYRRKAFEEAFEKGDYEKLDGAVAELKLDSDKCYFCSITLKESNNILRQAREKMESALGTFSRVSDVREESLNTRWEEIEKEFELCDLTMKISTVTS